MRKSRLKHITLYFTHSYSWVIKILPQALRVYPRLHNMEIFASCQCSETPPHSVCLSRTLSRVLLPPLLLGKFCSAEAERYMIWPHPSPHSANRIVRRIKCWARGACGFAETRCQFGPAAWLTGFVLSLPVPPL